MLETFGDKSCMSDFVTDSELQRFAPESRVWLRDVEAWISLAGASFREIKEISNAKIFIDQGTKEQGFSTMKRDSGILPRSEEYPRREPCCFPPPSGRYLQLKRCTDRLMKSRHRMHSNYGIWIDCSPLQIGSLWQTRQSAVARGQSRRQQWLVRPRRFRICHLISGFFLLIPISLGQEGGFL